MTDEEAAQAVVFISALESQNRANYQAHRGGDQAEADQDLVTARQAGCLRSVLERRIVQRATRAQLAKSRIA